MVTTRISTFLHRSLSLYAHRVTGRVKCHFHTVEPGSNEPAGPKGATVRKMEPRRHGKLLVIQHPALCPQGRSPGGGEPREMVSEGLP
jgi:hypothetical protein